MSIRLRTILLLLGIVIVSAATSWSVPPSPEAKAQFIQEGIWDQVVANLKAFEASQPPDMLETNRQMNLGRYRAKMATSADAIDTVRLCVILVEFPDFSHTDSTYAPAGPTFKCRLSATPQMFDSLLFSEQGKDDVFNPTGSMTEYYMEVSYGHKFIQGNVFGWYKAPNNYSYYVGADNGMNKGRQLAREAVLAADIAGVDFSPYANGGTNVPSVIIIHAGPGAEEDAYGIWSHSSAMSVSVNADGVSLSQYTMQPEETRNQARVSSIGVFCHEYGHAIGFPDLYDVNYNPGSEGLGAWSLMASGSWNGGGQRPSHPDVYCKWLVGFNSVQALPANILNAEIPQAETSPVAYLLQDNPGGAKPGTVVGREPSEDRL